MKILIPLGRVSSAATTTGARTIARTVPKTSRRETAGLILAALCFLIYAAEQVPGPRAPWGSEDFPLAGVFFGLAFYTGNSRRRVLGLFLGGVTLLFGFLGLNTWLLLDLWVGAAVTAFCGFRWQDRRQDRRARPRPEAEEEVFACGPREEAPTA